MIHFMSTHQNFNNEEAEFVIEFSKQNKKRKLKAWGEIMKSAIFPLESFNLKMESRHNQRRFEQQFFRHVSEVGWCHSICNERENAAFIHQEFSFFIFRNNRKIAQLKRAFQTPDRQENEDCSAPPTPA